jgi:two-component system, cell cycle response regulator DivK
MPATNVLIADGDDDSRVIYATILRHEGFNVIEASSGSEAMDLLRIHRPDAVITNMTLKGVDGLTLLRHVKAQWPLLHLPVIVLTASIDANGRLQAEAAGCAAFLLKPRTPREVVNDLRLALQWAAQPTD